MARQFISSPSSLSDLIYCKVSWSINNVCKSLNGVHLHINLTWMSLSWILSQPSISWASMLLLIQKQHVAAGMEVTHWKNVQSLQWESSKSTSPWVCLIGHQHEYWSQRVRKIYCSLGSMLHKFNAWWFICFPCRGVVLFSSQQQQFSSWDSSVNIFCKNGCRYYCAISHVEILMAHRVWGENLMFVYIPRNEWIIYMCCMYYI